MIKVTIAEIRELRLCVSGAREWCAVYGFDFRELIKSGLNAEQVAATQDKFGIAAADLAMRKAANGR